MKEIQAYQSDDGSFVWTKEQVLGYEKKQRLTTLFLSFEHDRYPNQQFAWVNLPSMDYFISYLEDAEDFREFVKIVYGFKE